MVDVLAGFVGGLVSGILSGYYAAHAQAGYQLRATTTNEVRKLTIEARRAFHNWIMRPAYTRGPGEFYGGREVGTKIDALSHYYQAQAEWLDDKARESLEQIIHGLGAHYTTHMEACTNKDLRKEQYESAGAAEEWLNGEPPRLMENVRALPWWRRPFR